MESNENASINTTPAAGFDGDLDLSLELELDGLLDDEDGIEPLDLSGQFDYDEFDSEVVDELADKQSRIEAVSYILASGEPIDYGRWSFLATQLRYFDREELARLTAALMPGSEEWEDDGSTLTFKAGGATCHVNTMSSPFAAYVEIGAVYPTGHPSELPAELKLVQAFLDAKETRNLEGMKEAGRCLFEIGGETEMKHFTTKDSTIEAVHVPAFEYYDFDLCRERAKIAVESELAAHAAECNPSAMRKAAAAKEVVGALFPEDMVRFVYDWQGKRDGAWAYFDSLTETIGKTIPETETETDDGDVPIEDGTDQAIETAGNSGEDVAVQAIDATDACTASDTEDEEHAVEEINDRDPVENEAARDQTEIEEQ